MPAHGGQDADNRRLFAGVRFALLGFDPVSESQYRSEMVQRGGVDTGAYGAGCTHLIVCDLLYDNPICVAARKDGTKVVSEQWVDDSLDLGEMADADRVLYRPVRDFSGIPGSQSLRICLTGYQKNWRDDIMKMASLMGAEFSKSFDALKDTHLICYKFEGEKYKVAKRENTAKRANVNLVNHQWLEDCLMAWKILPADDYTKSGWEIEIMAAQAKDSEDDEEEAGRSSSHSKRATRSARTKEIRMATLVDPHSQAPTRDPTISSCSAEITAGGHMSTPERITKAGGSTSRSLNIKSDIRNTPISADSDAYESAHFPLNGKEEAPAAQVHRAEAKDDVKMAVDASPGAHCISNIAGTTVCSDHHVHQSTTAPAMLVDKTETIGGNCLDSSNQNNVNIALWSTPSKETFSEKTLRPSGISGNVGQKDGGSTPDLNTAVDQSNTERELTLCEANLRLTGNAASKKNSQVLSYNRRRCRKSVSPEANLKPTGSPQSFEGVTPRVDFTISPSMKSDHKISDITDAESLRDVEIVKKVNKSSGALAQKRASKLSSINMKPSVSSETGTANSPFSSRESASEAATFSDPSRNSAESVILTAKEKSGPSKSNLLSYRRALKLARPVEGEKLSENSTKSKKSLRENTLALHEVDKGGSSSENGLRSEKGCAANSSADSEVDKRSSSSSLQNRDTEMSDVPQVDKTEVVAPNTDFAIVVSHQNMEVVPKSIQVTATISECETFPQEEPTSKVKNASVKRFGNASNKAATRSVKNKDEIVSFKSDGDKVEVQPEKNHARPNGAECTVFIPEEIPNSKANNAATNNSRDALQMNTALALSKTELAEKNPGSASADEYRKSSCEKVSQTADVEMPDAPIVDSTGAMFSKSGFKEVFPPENAGSCPKRLSTNTNMGGPETCTPSIVPNNRVRKAAAKRKVSAVQQNSFGDVPCKNSSAVVSEFKFVYKRASEGPRNGSKKTMDQNLQSSNEDGARDAGVSFSEDDMRDRSKILQNSQARSSKRQKAADLMDGSTDHDKENLPGNHNISKSKYGNSCTSLNSFIQAAGSGKDRLADRGVVEENDCGMLTVLEHRLFILSGHRLLRKEYKLILRRLKGRVCRDSHQWSFQATHFISPELRRTEKLFAAAAAGRWILKSDYLTACNEAGKFLEEEPFEWHGNGLNNGDTISLDAPRKWRQLRQHTGHGAFYRMQIIIYGECISPSLDTLKRAVRAGDGTILATSPPYTRFLKKPDHVDFAVVSAGTPSADAWVEEFKRQGIPCISADYLVEYICRPGQSLNKHVLFNMHDLADKSHAKLLKGQLDDVLGEATEAMQLNQLVRLVDPTTGKED
uniref:BRCT domain-containing protein n=1 Tax=Oryza glumipatula TaxID=40148 RepID=A0A0E0APK3_9ORYZ